MAKVIHCREIGFDCDGVIRAATEEEALRQAAEHARVVHNVAELTPQMVAKVKEAIRDE